MKPRILEGGLRISGTLVFLAFLAGVLWSVVPFGGNTLPHWIEAALGVSFNWSALLASSVLGMMGVGAIGLFAAIQLLDGEKHGAAQRLAIEQQPLPADGTVDLSVGIGNLPVDERCDDGGLERDAFEGRPAAFVERVFLGDRGRCFGVDQG
ncbi:hypothetical protein PDESU_01452 [Pontiella desulfatans]|uniref:Uncharacterized protein n=1 Tax=Pontiella desulfatans TaxID=2750659 RepID=A0A6C2TYU6_PONDE|nr:hypothetical protein PDESU_01452 [Pontiella desulfatans]